MNLPENPKLCCLMYKLPKSLYVPSLLQPDWIQNAGTGLHEQYLCATIEKRKPDVNVKERVA